MQPTSSSPLEPVEDNTQAATYGSCEAPEIDEPLDWESNGSLLNLLIDIASEAISKVFLLVTLVASLESCEGSFLKCNQEDTPQLNNYGEVLLCHYTKAFVFTFPAMATAVLLLLFGRDFLQKRFYYGLLKAGGVISFSDNTAWKDTFFMAMCFDFCHCVGYTCLHMIVLNRAGQEATSMRGFVPQANTTAIPMDGVGVSTAASTTTAVTALTTTLAVKGAMLLLHRSGPVPGGNMRGPGFGTGSQTFQKYLQTVMVLVATFLETLLLIVFMYFAYDITGTLVPMSEYLDCYEDQEENPMEDLHSFRDSVAKAILEHSPQIISGADGDLNKVYARIVDSYVKNKDLIRHPGEHPPDESQVEAPSPEEPSEDTEPEEFTLADFPTIGLFKSLWPAELLLRRDVAGSEARNFRRVWVIYSALAIFWLFQISAVLVVEGSREVRRLMDHEIEVVIPLIIIIFHFTGVGITVFVFCESLAPLGFTRELMGRKSES